MTILTSWGWTSNCLVLKSSVLQPIMEGTTVIEFKVSFESEDPQSRTISDVNSDIVANMAVYALTKDLEYSCSLGYPMQFKVGGTLGEIFTFKLYKERMTLPGRPMEESYRTTQYETGAWYPKPPMHKVIVPDHLTHHVSTVQDPHSPLLSMIIFELRRGHKRVHTFEYGDKWSKLLISFGSAGGIVTFLGACFTFCFPRKYPRSKVSTIYDQRTLLGHTAKDVNRCGA
eukprot:gnl/MRDRNA2_/MRDRNA2_174320_c0_seq1.p1 gnl/MRDRNA2_/MRDRNA2_174320_c0~~gnl/MRDRNA2_/MRDRNA2_174320_c0_seq1.p1  ORF type:complete len:229 (-),score=22.19 gnl/MRDRNA2_/MRDRNA2_174320_c0_seq1:212-898(-)